MGKKKLTDAECEALTGLEQLAEAHRTNKTPADEAFLLASWAAHLYPEVNHALVKEYLRRDPGKRAIRMPGEKLVFLQAMYEDMAMQVAGQVVPG